MAQYDATSPYYNTPYQQFFLSNLVGRPIPSEADDRLFLINLTYQYRPDLLAFDLYDNATLWWVFYQRNPNTLIAPPWDFLANTQIYLPKLSVLRSTLGF